MPFFRKSSRSSTDKAAGAKTKNQKDSSKKKRKGGFLRKKKTPLTHSEDASRASSTQPQPRWSKIETKIETDLTGLQPTTKGNVKAPLIKDSKKTPSIIVDGEVEQKEIADKNWAAFEKNLNGRLTMRNNLKNQENEAFPKMQAIQEDVEVDLRKHQSADDKHITRMENEAFGPVDVDEFIEQNVSDQPSFPNQEQEYVPRFSNDEDNTGLEGRTNSLTDDSTSAHEKSYADDFTCEMTYSQSVSSEGDAEEPAPEEEQQDTRAEDKQEVPEKEQLDDESQDEPEEPEGLDGSNPEVSAYVSLNRIPKSDLTHEFTTSSLNLSKSEEESSQRSEWKPKSDMTDPLGATPQEIDALNRFLSVVGPDFDGRKLSLGDRKEIYDGARKVGLNKVLVDKFLDQSAGTIATVEEVSTVSDLSPCSSYSTTSRSIRVSKSEYSDQTSTTGFSGQSDNTDSSDSIRYKYLPRTSDSPHANQNYGCKGIFGEFLWNDPKKARKDIFKTGKGILESIGAVVAREDGSVDGEV